MNNIQKMDFAKIVLPQFVEVINERKHYVSFGIDNLFPEYLKSLMAKSPLHSSILTQKARMVGGYGFNKTSLQMKSMLFLKNMLGDYDMDELLYRVSYDLELYGAFALNIVWSKDRERIASINYLDASKVRIQPVEKDSKYPSIENYWYSDGWEDERKYPPTLYQGFSTRYKKKASQILYVKEQRAGVEFYGIPDYIPGIRWMETDWLISDFHMNNIRNGFAPSYIVTMPAMGASDEQRVYLAGRLKEDLEGASNAGRWYINFVDNIEDKPSFEPIEMNNSDTRFMILADQIQKSILQSHRVVNPMLFGIEEAGKLGGRNEILESLELFQTSYIGPKQSLLEKEFNRLARVNEVEDRLIINVYSDNFKSVNTNVSDIITVLTADITPEQKFWLLVANGYVHQSASKLTGYTEGNLSTKSVGEVEVPETVQKLRNAMNGNINKK